MLFMKKGAYSFANYGMPGGFPIIVTFLFPNLQFIDSYVISMVRILIACSIIGYQPDGQSPISSTDKRITSEIQIYGTSAADYPPPRRLNMLGETTIHKTPSLCESVGNYKIEQYICGKYISKHHKHKTHNFYVENLPNVRRKNHGTVVHSNNSTINNNRNT
jgi:hypothetical protein